MFNYITKWNLADTYMVQLYQLDHLLTTSHFGHMEGEQVKEVEQPRYKLHEDALNYLFDKTDREMILRIAMSKYLTADQLHQYMWLSGSRISTGDICRRLRKMMMTRTLRQVQLLDGENGVKNLDCYKLDYWGNKFAKAQGLYLHKGIQYLDFQRAKNQGKLDSSSDVRRVLIANQILLNLLKSHTDILQFGFMETLRPVTEGHVSYEGVTAPLVRPQLSAILQSFLPIKKECDGPVLLAYEIIRNNPEGKEKIADKLKRFEALEDSDSCYMKNYHSFAEKVQYIFCGESEAHNKEIYSFLKEHDLIKQGRKILFTDDSLVAGGSTDLYEIVEDGSLILYELPVRYVTEVYAA